MSFDRSKIVAILTGVIALALGFAYLILVQVLDSRGPMQPAPPSVLMPSAVVSIEAAYSPNPMGQNRPTTVADRALACKSRVI